MALLGKPSEDNEFLLIPELGGKIYIVKTILYYDIPRMFVCSNDKEELFLFNEIENEDTFTVWGVIKVSIETLEKFFKQQLSYRNLYKDNLDSYFTVKANLESEENFSIKVDFSAPSDWVFDFYNDDRCLYYNLYDSVGE